jgi:hypothetical protein
VTRGHLPRQHKTPSLGVETMADKRQLPYAELLSVKDVDSYVYETVATLEYTGRPVTRPEIAAATDLDDQAIDASLAVLADRGMLTRTTDGGEVAFAPAERGWSAAPEQGQGLKQEGEGR